MCSTSALGAFIHIPSLVAGTPLEMDFCFRRPIPGRIAIESFSQFQDRLPTFWGTQRKASGQGSPTDGSSSGGEGSDAVFCSVFMYDWKFEIDNHERIWSSGMILL